MLISLADTKQIVLCTKPQMIELRRNSGGLCVILYGPQQLPGRKNRKDGFTINTATGSRMGGGYLW
jgi:hypothetical protein